jgi:hypothetical protein
VFSQFIHLIAAQRLPAKLTHTPALHPKWLAMAQKSTLTRIAKRLRMCPPQSGFPQSYRLVGACRVEAAERGRPGKFCFPLQGGVRDVSSQEKEYY